MVMYVPNFGYKIKHPLRRTLVQLYLNEQTM